MFVAFSPIENISKDYPPTLFIHGDKDTDVPCDQSRKMAEKLKQFGVVNDIIIEVLLSFKSMTGYRSF